MEQNREMGAMEVLQLLPHDAEIQNAVGNYQHAPQPPTHQCPRCFSMNTKFCYYNNYNVNQPRHFCKECRRYWTVGGSIRDIPIGGTSRRGKKPSGVYPQWNALPASATIVPGPMLSLMSTEPGTIDALPFQIFPHAYPALMSDSGSLSAAHRMRPVSLLGLTDPELTLLGGLSNPYEFSNMMGSDFALSGDLNLPPSGLQQQINCSQGNYLDGSEMPISQQFANEQSLVFSNMHPTGPLMSQQSLNIGNDVLDPEAVLLCGYRNYAMGGSTMDPICWSLFPEFGPFV